MSDLSALILFSYADFIFLSRIFFAHELHFLSPTDYTDLKDFYNPNLTILHYAQDFVLIRL